VIVAMTGRLNRLRVGWARLNSGVLGWTFWWGCRVGLLVVVDSEDPGILVIVD
jgi:hypothetical protein